MTPFQQLYFRIRKSIKVKEHVLTKAERASYAIGDWQELAPKQVWYDYANADVLREKPEMYVSPSVQTIAGLFDKKEVSYACYDIYKITPFWGKAFYLLGDYGNDYWSHPMQVYAPCTISEDWVVECGLICYDVITSSYFVKDYMKARIPEQFHEGLTIEDFGGKRPYAFHPELKGVHLNFYFTDEREGRGSMLPLVPTEFSEEVVYTEQ